MKHHFAAGCKSLMLCTLCAFLSVAAKDGQDTSAQVPTQRPQSGEGQASGPLVCDAPEYDFGEQDQTVKLKHSFHVRNAADGPVTIDRVLTTCGCTAATLDKKTLAPGETVPLDVEISLAGNRGQFQKHIYVLSGGGTQTKTRLTIKGTVVERVRVTPRTVNLGYSAADTPTESTATLEAADASAKFTVRDIGTDSAYLELNLETSADGMTHTLHVRTKPPLPLGSHPATVRVFTDREEFPRLDIPVALRVVDKLEMVPKEVILYDRGTSAEDSAIRFLNVMPGSAREFTVTGVEVPVEGITAEIIPRPESRYLVKLHNVPVDKSLDGKEIVLLTDIPGRERVAVPIRVKPYPHPQSRVSTPVSGEGR